ncbi:MAG TPA: hypothetical protein VIE66_04305 [Methylocella sp.]|jgi:hypothetical protein
MTEQYRLMAPINPLNRAQRRRVAKLSPMARLVLEIMEEANANGEITLTEDQIEERVNNLLVMPNSKHGQAPKALA